MADSPGGTESVGDSGDDAGLTIRIPNPKVYMARQSQWKGRRGKPRCDHCRLNNLKCDRVLPTCNHCAWANGRKCKYTPLPTPAHRGIPRCDRCRQRNLKCDRNLPVCNHCAEDNETDCNYTPKKRHKVPSDHGSTRDRPAAPYAAKTASFLVSDMPSTYGALPVADGSGSYNNNSNNNSSGPSGSHVFEGEMRTEPQIKQYMPPGSPGFYDEEPGMDDPNVAYQQQNPDGSVTWVRKGPLPPLLPKNIPPGQGPSAYNRPFMLDQGMIVTTPHIDPWMHPSFVPLPDLVVNTLRTVNAIEMPTRHAFEEVLVRFVGGLSPELRDTATFIPEVYAHLAHAVAQGHIQELSLRMQMWLTCHHARSGSRKRHLILLPRDAFFNMHRDDEEKLRLNYVLQTDGEAEVEHVEKDSENGLGSLESAAVFERVPVQPQIFDILVYIHRNHGSSSTMLFEARRIGMATITWPMVEMFIRLCPLCKMRSKGAARVIPEEEHPSSSFRPPSNLKR
ncbi:hypothetical protein BKA93DRAFT_756330 [Sparassis latifolia]|uniref:Zn(2)-C6 fungal-type domain-containing protein n=1 Tax=Sparassis crispa TaxID=139825 RepID=A0A401GGK2_9APHY|nr:predicted protein [Sparassis crispa]GBE81241.1 predicted protein [Sparassis crispa]